MVAVRRSDLFISTCCLMVSPRPARCRPMERESDALDERFLGPHRSTSPVARKLLINDTGALPR
jgi:hypothetical protein